MFTNCEIALRNLGGFDVYTGYALTASVGVSQVRQPVLNGAGLEALWLASTLILPTTEYRFHSTHITACLHRRQIDSLWIESACASVETHKLIQTGARFNL